MSYHNTHTQARHSNAVEAAIPPRRLTLPGGRRVSKKKASVIYIHSYLPIRIDGKNSHILKQNKILLTTSSAVPSRQRRDGHTASSC